jgi:hypothetical protein
MARVVRKIENMTTLARQAKGPRREISLEWFKSKMPKYSAERGKLDNCRLDSIVLI